MSLALKIIFVVTNLVLITTSTAFRSSDSNVENFIRKNCKLAVYQNVCFEMLKPYARYLEKNLTERQLVKLSIAVCLKTTNNAHKLVVSQHFHTLSKSASLGQCVDQLGSSAEKLNASLYEFRISGTPRAGLYKTRLSKVWEGIDNALTDTKDCKDSLADTSIGEVRSMLKEKVNEADQSITNALTLCNKLINSKSTP